MKLDHQVLVFTYHKTGTTLFENIVAKLCGRFGLTMRKCYGMTPFIDPAPDIVLVIHSLLGALPARPFRAIRAIRDPRDIWISGYLYHRHCREPWCTSTDFDPAPPIRFPRVPAAFHHRRERWKRDYLAGLAGRSYQQNLLDRDEAAGMEFELANYTGCTLEAMRAWPYRAEVRDVTMEDIADDFDGEMRRLFTHLGFPAEHLDEILTIAATEDVGRMADAVRAANTHIHGRSISKWKTGLTPAQLATIETRFGDVIAGHGYALSPRPGA